ncbi:MAG: polyprenyl synthetase family protein, partial [Actinomycetota bacterium]
SARRDFAPATAERIGLFKTAKYTIERPLQIGALIADPTVADGILDALSGYGVSLGVAFQMRDDVLGVFGEPDVTGKPAGDDLRESKPTALIAEAIAAASPAQRSVLDHIGDPRLDSSKVDDIRRVIAETGALASVESKIKALTESAVRSLDEIDLHDDVREKFVSLAHAIAWRSV